MIKKWIETLVSKFYYSEAVIDFLTNECHIERPSELYCVNNINKIIGDCKNEKAAYNLKIFFAALWEYSKKIRITDFLIGLGLNKQIVDIICSKYSSLEEIRKVNYEELLSLGIEKNEAEEFIERMIYLSDEMDFLLNNGLIRFLE